MVGLDNNVARGQQNQDLACRVVGLLEKGKRATRLSGLHERGNSSAFFRYPIDGSKRKSNDTWVVFPKKTLSVNMALVILPIPDRESR